MITGFNSDIEHGGKVFHVQTEEKGLGNPVVITLVYCGGEIVTSFEASYADLVGDDPTPEGEVRRRMSEQHQGLIQDILRGRYSPTQMPYGHDLISGRSLDELVLGYLEDEVTERTAKVGRVLNKLERFLSAAEQAQVEPEPPAEPAAVEDAPVEKSGETVDVVEIESTPDVEPQVAVPTPERRRRKIGWIWAAVAATLVFGVAGLYVIRSLAVPIPAPVVESSREAVEESTDVQAGVSGLTDAAPTVSETVHIEPTKAAPASPEIPPVVDRPVAKPQPDTVVDEPLPAPEPAVVEPVETAAPTVIEESTAIEEPIVESDPIVAEEPIDTAQDVDVSPVASQRDLPRYTRRARRLQQEGIIELRILIDSHGDVADAELISGIPDSDLNEAALEVTRDWTFSPARKDGRRVEVWKEVAFEFSVRPDRTTSVRIRE